MAVSPCDMFLHQAAHFCRKAAELGHPGAMSRLGVFLEEGEGVMKDEKEAARWYQLSAEKGDTDGLVNHAMNLQKKNPSEARRLYRAAAEKGHPDAQITLAKMLAQGDGGKQDLVESHCWCLKAAKQDVKAAMYTVGQNFRKGTGVAQDFTEALKWYRRGVVHGNSSCQLMLGNLHLHMEHGQKMGVRYDVNEAHRLFRLSAAQGNANATKMLEQLDRVRQDDLLASMGGWSMGVPGGARVPILPPDDPRWANPTEKDLRAARRELAKGRTPEEVTNSGNPMLGGWMLGVQLGF